MATDIKLANVVLHVDDHAAEHPELYYRCAPSDARYDAEAGALCVTGAVDFLTYINGLSAIKWRKYTGIEQVALHVAYAGSGTLTVTGVRTDASSVEQIARYDLASEETLELVAQIDAAGFDLVGFSVAPTEGSTVSICRAFYTASVEEGSVNSVSLAIATTTFQNERYILPNIELVKKGIAAEGGVLARSFHMFVVDNGRTLDVEALSDEVVTVLPNPNAGGSGGFARGMMAASEVPGAYTHVIVMDDDVRIMPESFVRVFALLSLARGAYRHAFINGAMLSLEEPTRQFEDVAYVVDNGAYRRIKRDADAGTLEGMLYNERTSVEVPNAYGAWWFSCIPVENIRQNGLPMPFFIRCDDVEFGVRNNPTYMTMDGICVWHASFEGRYRASVDCYQYTRNFLATVAVDDCASEFWTIQRLTRSIRLHLRDLDYISAERLLDGFEDYLKGPEFLAQADGSAIMKKLGALNEKHLDVAELDQAVLREAGVTPEVIARTDLVYRPSKVRRLLRSIPYDRHYLPDFLLKKKPGYVVKNVSVALESNSSRCKTVVFLDATRQHGAIRHMDRARFKAIRRREHALMARYRREGKKVRAAWKKARPYLTSREFWTQYLGIASKA